MVFATFHRDDKFNSIATDRISYQYNQAQTYPDTKPDPSRDTVTPWVR